MLTIYYIVKCVSFELFRQKQGCWCFCHDIIIFFGPFFLSNDLIANKVIFNWITTEKHFILHFSSLNGVIFLVQFLIFDLFPFLFLERHLASGFLTRILSTLVTLFILLAWFQIAFVLCSCIYNIVTFGTFFLHLFTAHR